MGMKDDIEGRLKEILAVGDYQIQESDNIPGPRDPRLSFGNTGVRFEATTLYIDMRGSTKILNDHRAQNVAKIHKAYLYVATTLIAESKGQIRSYNGDSILAFFSGSSKAALTLAVSAAMKIKYMLTQICNKEFERYQPLDFGIGIDQGHILCVKAGRAGNDNHNDLVWLGDAVNRATVLSDGSRSPQHISTSDACWTKLEESLRVGKTGDLWAKKIITYNVASEAAWSTSCHMEVK